IVEAQHIPVEMSADANIPEMPENIVPVLIYGALVIGKEFRDEFQNLQVTREEYERRVGDILVDVRKTSRRPRLVPNVESLQVAFPGR
ncbi:hypothetical protein LCGC14_2583650, partial [marine sediment metagenome]